MRRLIIFLLLLSPLTMSAQNGEMARRMELGEALYRKGQYIEAEREFGLAKQATTGGNAVELERVTFLYARSAYMAGSQNAVSLLYDYWKEFNRGVHFAEAMMMLGNKLLAEGENMSAVWVLSIVNEKMLPKEQRDEYRFKLGYARVLGEDYDKVSESLVKIDSTSSYYLHAQYLMAYADYVAGRYDEARKFFKTASQAEEYRALVPFYMLQLDFAQGRWRSVLDNSAKVLLSDDVQQVIETERMVGIAMYRLKNWRGAAAMLAKYEADEGDNGGFLMREESYMLGSANYMDGNYGAAEKYLRSVVAGDDMLTQNASYMLGDVYLRGGDRHSAMQSFSVAAAMGYDAEIQQDALFNYSKLSYELGDGGTFNEAVNMMKRYLALYPVSPHRDEIRGYLVASYYNSHDFEEAMKLVSEITNPDPTTRLATQKIIYWRAVEQFREGEWDSAMALFEQSKAGRMDAKYTALADFWEGEILYRQGKYSDAIAKYNAYLKVAPTTEPEAIEAQYNIGYAYFNQKKWTDARKSFDAFLTRYKGNDEFEADALNRRGDIEYAQKAYWKAIEFYTKASAYDVPARYYAQFQRAMMLGLVDRAQRKVESLNDIIRTDEGDFIDAATFELGRTLMSQEKYADAVRVFDNLAQQFPSSLYYGEAGVYQGLAYRNLKDTDRAEVAYKRVLMRERGTQAAEDALAGIRDIYTDRGDVEGYVRYAQSIEHQTIDADAALMAEQIAERERIAAEVARIEKEKSDYAAIQNAFTSNNLNIAEELILGFNPQSNYLKAKAFITLGDIYVKRGDTFQARATYQSIVNGYPDTTDGIIDEAQERIKTL